MDREDRDNFRTIANQSAGPRSGYRSDSDRRASQPFRHDPASCLAKARAIFSCYRRDEAQDPEGFVANLTVVLGDYPASIVDLAADPRTGIITAFPMGLPNVGQIGQWLDAQQQKQERLQHYASLPKVEPQRSFPKPPPEPGDLANVFVPVETRQYPQMVKRAGTDGVNPREFKYVAGGIMVALGWFDTPAPASQKGLKPLTDDALRALYPKPKAEDEEAA